MKREFTALVRDTLDEVERPRNVGQYQWIKLIDEMADRITDRFYERKEKPPALTGGFSTACPEVQNVHEGR